MHPAGLSVLCAPTCGGRGDRLEPPVRVRRLSLHNLEEFLLSGFGHRAPAAAAHLDLIHCPDWGYLDCRTDKEHLIRDIEHLPGSVCSRTSKPMSRAR